MINNNLIQKYYPDLPTSVVEKISHWFPLFKEVNSSINLISRKDIDNFIAHHVLHCLIYHKFLFPDKNSKILDIGCGGGLPGIILALIYPDNEVVMIDSIQKKISAVNLFIRELKIANAKAICTRSEQFKGSFDIITARAVSNFANIHRWSGHLQNKQSTDLQKGYWLLKGINASEEIPAHLSEKSIIYPIYDFLPLEYMTGKALFYIPFA